MFQRKLLCAGISLSWPDIYVISRVWMMGTGKEVGRGREDSRAGGRGRKEGGDLDRGGSVNSPRGASPPPSSSPPQFILLPILDSQKHWTTCILWFWIVIAECSCTRTHLLHEQNTCLVPPLASKLQWWGTLMADCCKTERNGVPSKFIF